MLISEENNTEISIYGKTGMGKAEGIVVDAWFTGFAETLEGNKYFLCISRTIRCRQHIKHCRKGNRHSNS